jgi:hypothetical protein
MSNSFGESARFSPRNVEKLASNTDKDRSYPMQTKDHWSMAGYTGHIPRHQDTFAEVFDVSVIEAETRYVTEQRGRGQSPRKNPDMADIGTTSRRFQTAPQYVPCPVLLQCAVAAVHLTLNPHPLCGRARTATGDLWPSCLIMRPSSVHLPA